MVTVLSGPTGDRAGHPRHHPLPAQVGHAPSTRCRRSCWPTGSAAPSVAWPATPQDFADRGYAVLDLDRAGLRPQRRRDPPGQPRLRGARRAAADRLAGRPARHRARTPPATRRSAAVGGSYGGALALMLAGQDPRVDAIVPMITWNDLANAFLPEATGAGPAAGRVQEAVGGPLLRSGRRRRGPARPARRGSLGRRRPGRRPTRAAAPEPAGASAGALADPACGRFAKDVCAAYLDVATTGKASPADDRPAAPVQPGAAAEPDQGADPADPGPGRLALPAHRGARPTTAAIAATGTPVRVDWFTGGHDGGSRAAVRPGPAEVPDDHLARLLPARARATSPSTGFTFSRVVRLRRRHPAASPPPASPPTTSPDRRHRRAGARSRWPGRRSGSPTRPTATRPRSPSLPGTGSSFASLLDGASLEIPGQHADFYSAAADRQRGRGRRADGAASGPRRRPARRCCSSSSTTSTRRRGSSLPFGLAAPVRLTGLPADHRRRPRRSRSRCPASCTGSRPGTGCGSRSPPRTRRTRRRSQPAVYTVALAGRPAPVTPAAARPATPIANPDVIWRYVLAGAGRR